MGKTNAKDQWTVTLAQLCCALDEVESDDAQSHASTATTANGHSIMTAPTPIDSTDNVDASGNEQLRTHPPNGPYFMPIQWHDGSYDVVSFFRKATSCVRVSVGTSSNAVATVVSIVDTSAGPILVIEDFLPSAWRRLIKAIKSPPLRTANCEVVSVEALVPLLVPMDDLSSHPLFVVGENLTVSVLLETSFVDCCIRGVLPSERKMVSWHSRQL